MAAPTAFEIWEEDLLSRLPSAEPNNVASELTSTLREFYTRSGAWIEDISIPMKAGRKAYQINPIANNVQMLYVTRATVGAFPVGIYDARPLRPLTANTSTQIPVRIWLQDPDTVLAYPTPFEDGTDPVILTGGCTFIDGKCHTPQKRIVSHFYEHILDGCLGRLMLQVKRPYTNPTSAAYHLKRFRNGIGEARDMARRSWAMTEKTGWAFPQAWAGSDQVRWSRRFGH